MAYTLKQKTQLYHQLFVGYKASLPLAVMLGPEFLPPAFGNVSVSIQRMLDKGRPLSAILATTKLVEPWEAKMLSVGEASGRLEGVLADLETFFSARMQQVAALKAKLVYPALVIVVAIVVGPLPALAAGKLAFGTYVAAVVARLAVCWLLYRLLLVRTLERAIGGAFNPLLVFAAGKVNSNHWLRQLFEISYLNLLTACLEAGVDAVETLRVLREALDNKRLRQQHLLAINNIQKHGVSLAQALSASGILCNFRIISFFTTAETAGALHSDLRTFVLKQRAELDNLVRFKLKLFGKWLYLAMLLMAVAGYFR